MFKELLTDVTLILVFLFVLHLVLESKAICAASTIWRRMQVGIVNGAYGLILMQFAVRITDTLIMDLRHIVIVLAARYGGVPGALTASLIIAAGRLTMFPFSTTAVISSSNVLLSGLLCAWLSTRKWPSWQRLVAMHATSMGSVTIIFIYLVDPQVLPLLLTCFWIISVLAGLMAQWYSSMLTEKKEMANKLAQSEAFNRAILDNVPEAIIIHADGHIVYCNPFGARLMGAVSSRKMLGEPILQFIHPDDHPLVLERIRQITQERKHAEAMEERLVRLDGTVIDVEVTGISIEYNGQSASLVVVKDITSRKRQARMLAEAHERTSNILESIADAFFSVDRHWRFTYVNREAERVLGRSKEMLIGCVIWDEFPRVMHTKFHDAYQEAMQHDRSVSVQTYFEPLDEWFEVRAFPSKEGLSVYFHNITDRKQAELELKQLNEELQRYSYLDGLTGLANRRAFDLKLLREWEKGAEEGTPLSLLLLDIDYFKLYNDTYGHEAGDRCLKQVAEKLTELVVGTDRMISRYGGEEFAIVLPGAALMPAMRQAERIRAGVESMGIPHSGSSVSGVVTVSIGVASTRPGAEGDMKSLLIDADRALYRCKERRNCASGGTE
ncbi:diguanylate cyclase [Paenibacillus methanolicus]|uniref:PAS domain S-box-containing protein/diguanylate cyclase (GGDEF)-like protein n=1 Tax=Paenibacillus methanolicus TaxID=582686 RepID=A0A5S5CGZ0_9BACL|nr:diguanylate cyclase [Paenibacillus methanolicus]TYP79046.1 PAS domain S-box-containing protein/diguanylate cyclase (GGDEF)-like protein [Paenibacillus methanolicus]